MSWMDSWSRPSKSQATPPPLYLTHGDAVPYCRTCGRVIGRRKQRAGLQDAVKYCSARCRGRKIRGVDREIERVFVALLEGVGVEDVRRGMDVGDLKERGGGLEERERGGKKGRGKGVKGDPRIVVECKTVEEIVFAREKDPRKIFGRRKNRAARGVVEDPGEWRSVDMVDELAPPGGEPSTASEKSNFSDAESEEDLDEGSGIEKNEEKPTYGYGGGKIRPPQAESDINGSIGGEKGWAERTHETDEMKAKRKEGERRAEEKEMVRRAARRGVAFGFGEGEKKRKCEAVMKGVVVEASFAKGEWGIRWREKV